MKNKGKFGGAKVLLLATAGIAVGGYASYRVLFTRSGEAATALIRSDAGFVLTLDAHPSASQVGAFEKIGGILKSSGSDSTIEEGISSMIGKAGLAKEIRQYLTNDLALAVWPTEVSNKTHGLILLSVSNPDAVATALKGATPVSGVGIDAYKFSQGDGVIGVVGNYLAMASDTETLKTAVDTKNGGASIMTSPEYQAARKALPSDANLMVFVSPSALALATKLANAGTSLTPVWASMSVAVRSDGLQIDGRFPVQNNSEFAAALAATKPLDPAILKKLPEGALGVFAMAQTSQFVPLALKNAPQASKTQIDQSINTFEKETGISVDKDIIPAFQGDTVLAVYPAEGPIPVNGVLMVDNANGANPDALVAKVRAFIEKKSGEDAAKTNSHPATFVETKIGTTVYEIDAQTEKAIQSNMHGDPAKGPAQTTIAYAVNNGTLMISSSRALLTNAVLSLNGSRALSDDPAFAGMTAKLNPNDHQFMMLAATRILETISKALTNEGKEPDFIKAIGTNFFGDANAGMVVSGRIEGNVTICSTFIPLNYDQIGIAVGKLKNSSGATPTTPTAPALPATGGSFTTR